MDQLTLLFVVLLSGILAVPVGSRVKLPPPVLMTILGVVLAVLPFVPDVRVEPDLILPLVLPPLLYAAAQRTSWRDRLVRALPETYDESRRAAARERMAYARRFREREEETLSASRPEMQAARSEPGADPELVDRVLRSPDLRSARP